MNSRNHQWVSRRGPTKVRLDLIHHFYLSKIGEFILMSSYSILLDSRERKLISACKELVIPYKTGALSLGDVHILDEKGSICMMIERKSWQDLASSIIDNRYKE